MAKKARDAFRTISEVADWLDVPAHVLRFWESKFAQIKPVKRAGGRRYYRPNDMLLIGGIKQLLHVDGNSIKAVQQMLRSQGVKHVASHSPALDDTADARPVRAKPAPQQPAPPPKQPPEQPLVEEAEIIEDAPFVHAETPDLFGGDNIVHMAPKTPEPRVRMASPKSAQPADDAVPLPLDLPPIPPKIKLPKALAVSKIRPTKAHKKRLAALQSIRALPYSAQIEDQDGFRVSYAKMQHLRDRMADTID